MDGVFDRTSFVRVCALEMDAKRHGKYLGSTVTVLYGPSVLRDLVRLFTSARGVRSRIINRAVSAWYAWPCKTVGPAMLWYSTSC